MTEKKLFMRISDACRYTGLSKFYLRKGCKEGTIPHIKSGDTYYINIDKLLQQLSAGS